MVLSNVKNQKKMILNVKPNKRIENKEKNFGAGYVGYDKNGKPLALVLDIDPPTLEPNRILETIPEVKQISQRKIEYSLHK